MGVNIVCHIFYSLTRQMGIIIMILRQKNKLDSTYWDTFVISLVINQKFVNDEIN